MPRDLARGRALTLLPPSPLPSLPSSFLPASLPRFTPTIPQPRARLEKLAAELGIASRVQFMGATESPERALAQMDVFAYPTTGEERV